MSKKIYVAPSLLSADYGNLESEIKKVSSAGAEIIHIDVMDGHFVPNISIGVPVVKAVRGCTDRIFDCHLMISEPLKYIDAFSDAGADIISFHTECESNITETIEKIKKAGKKPALAIKPKTSAEEVFPYLKDVCMVLVMTVEPGFGGQTFMPEVLPKIKAVREKANEINPDLLIEVDGGINKENAKLCTENGADVIVSGSYVFSAEDTFSAIESLRS